MVMKHYICIFLLSICMSLPIFASSALSRDSQARIDSLCFVALNHTNHGRYEESNAIIYNIMENYRLPKGSTRFMYGIMGQNAWLSGDYQHYYRCMSKSLKRKELKNQLFQKALSLLPPESLSRTDDEIDITFEVDSLFYEGEFKGCEMRIPTVIGGKEEKMILDNGCAFFSLSSESFAREHGIRPIGIGGKASGTVDNVSMWIGIADTLSIGPMLFQNILFTVIPDEYLLNPVTKIDAALGANIFRLAGEMDFDIKNRTITFCYAQKEYESNITINGSGCHYLDVAIGNDTLCFQLDLGASSTQMNSNYFTRYQNRIINECPTDSAIFGGVGGTDSEIVYLLNNIDIYACGGCFTKDHAKISTTNKSNQGDEFGVIGLDFLLNFERANLNLRNSLHLYVW